MAIKLFISDMDDSLLRDDQTIGPRTEAALRALRARGVRIALASGRMYGALQRYVRQLDIVEPLITYNGAMIVRPDTGEPLDRCFIPPETARDALRQCEDMGLYIQAYDEDHWYCDAECEFSRYYARVSGVQGIPLGRRLSEAVDWPEPKMLTINTPERTQELLPILREKFSGKLEAAISKPMYIELTHPDANKGAALKRLCGLLGIEPSEVMACGDGINDIGMIELAGLGVAVANAAEAVRTRADVVCGDNAHEGIAELIEQLLSKGEL